MPCSPGSDPLAIGGVFALAAPGAGFGPSLWDHWCGQATRVLCFRNARSAFAHLLRARAVPRVWLPAYCCADLAQAAGTCGTPIRFYGGSETLCPDTAALDAALRPGDLVLGLNHFGRPNAALRPLAAARTDVTWVEDCAQAADTATTPWARLRLYSPRKLLGVADGGLLIDDTDSLPRPRQRPAASARLRHAGLLRRHNEAENARWYAAFHRAEARMDVSDHAIDAQTLQVLRTTALASLATSRRQNYARLHAALADLALWPEPAPDWVPLGFPIRVPDAAALGAELARHRIFAPRHWATLATESPPAIEAALSQQLLTLPCDQRYGPRDMDRLIATVQRCAQWGAK